MKFCAADCQGYFSDNFVVKELAVCREGDWCNFTFTCSKPFANLTQNEVKQVRYLENNIHGLRYSNPGMMFSPAFGNNVSIKDILKHHFKDMDRVYVKGFIKKKFFDEQLNEIFDRPPLVINIEDMPSCPKLERCIDHSYCSHHGSIKGSNSFACSKYNSVQVYSFIRSFLPF